MYRPRCKSLSFSLSTLRLSKLSSWLSPSLSSSSLSSFRLMATGTYVGRGGGGQVCTYLPTYEQPLHASLLTSDCARYVGTYLPTYKHGPGALVPLPESVESQRGTPDTRQCMSCSISSSPIPTTYSPTYPTRRKL